MNCKHAYSDGHECQAYAIPGSFFCWRHNPDIPYDEKIAASARGGRAKSGFVPFQMPQVKLENAGDVLSLLKETINNMLSGNITQRSASSLGYLCFLTLIAMEKAGPPAEKPEKPRYKFPAEYEYDEEGNCRRV